MKKLSNLSCVLLTIFFMAFAVSLAFPSIGNPKEVSAASINKKSLVLIKGQRKTLKLSGIKKKQKIKWSSSKKSVATVSSKGKVTAKKKGKAVISAKVGKKTYKCKVTVQTPSLSQKLVSLSPGGTYQLKMNGTKQKVTWKSSNSSIARVNKGKITAVKAGTCNVYATVLGKKYTCKVTVKENVFKIGQTWKVPGQWQLTINSVEKTDYRNEFSDKNPAAVYYINYTYKNLGYVDKDGIMDGLYLDLDMGSIVDSAGEMGYSYPGDISNYPQQVPVGAYCNAQACIGVNHAGDFQIFFDHYDGNSVSRSAIFKLEVPK